MTDYTKLVEDLRYIEKTMFALGTTLINMDNVSIRLAYDKKWGRTAKDAADAIEALQAAEPTENQVVDYCHKRCLVVLGADLFHELKASYGKLPKRGKWIGVNPMVDTVQCSICGGQLFSAELETPYCPYCGAKMTEVQDGKRCD